MASTTYTDNTTIITADTMNDLNRLHYTILSDPADAAAVRTALGLVIGTNVQAQGATLTTIEALALAQGDLLYATAADTMTRLAKGTASQQLRMNAGATAPEWATIASSSVFTASFTSADQTITSAGALTLAHSLGAAPTLVQVQIKCTTAEQGYSIGDVVIVGLSDTTNANTGASIVIDATNLTIRFGSNGGAFPLLNKTSGGQVAIVNTSWVAIFKAWA